MENEKSFDQGRQVLKVFGEKVKTQAHLGALLSCGLLTDLLSADLTKIDRNNFRKVCGLSTSSWRVLLGNDKWIKPFKELREAGHYVEMESWQNLVERFRAGLFNIVVIDYRHDKDCLKHSREIKKLYPNCKIFYDGDFRHVCNDPNSDGDIDAVKIISELEWQMSK